MNLSDVAAHGWPCPTADEMRAADRHAIEEAGVPARVLMENAGRAVAGAILERFPQVRRPLVLCGGGNNGGDGFVVARVLQERDAGIRPLVRVFGDRSKMSVESRANLDLIVRAGVEVAFGGGKGDLELDAVRADLVVDAIFGVGLAREVTGELAESFRAVSALPVPVVAVDLPSGLSSDTGERLGAFMRADLVVTLGLPKLGLAVRPAEAEVLVADIGLPAESVAAAGIRQRMLTAESVRRRLPARPASAHKGTFGHVLVVGGSRGKTGAPCLAAEGALRGGAGLVTAAAPPALHDILEIKLTEAMTVPVGPREHEIFDAEALDPLLREAASREALVIGPGIGTHPATVELLDALLNALDRPAVVDADGLNAFGGRPEALSRGGPRLLTPHPGEMARLLGTTTARIQQDRPAAARELARVTGAVVVLKGARSLVSTPRGEVWINPTGGPGLATGGTGDVLAGLLGALLAQGSSPLDAALVGVWLHGASGDRLGPVGATAGDLAASLGAVWRELERGRPGPGRRDPHPFP